MCRCSTDSQTCTDNGLFLLAGKIRSSALSIEPLFQRLVLIAEGFFSKAADSTVENFPGFPCIKLAVFAGRLTLNIRVNIVKVNRPERQPLVFLRYASGFCPRWASLSYSVSFDLGCR